MRIIPVWLHTERFSAIPDNRQPSRNIATSLVWALKRRSWTETGSRHSLTTKSGLTASEIWDATPAARKVALATGHAQVVLLCRSNCSLFQPYQDKCTVIGDGAERSHWSNKPDFGAWTRVLSAQSEPHVMQWSFRFVKTVQSSTRPVVCERISCSSRFDRQAL